MLRTFATLAFSLLTALPAAALCSGESYFDRLSDSDRAQIDAAVAQTPYPTGLLWQATKDDATITLIGTIHINDARLTPIRDSLTDIVQAADLMMVEATPSQEAEMQAALLADPSLYLITDGPTLPDLLAPSQWDAAVRAAATRDLPSFMIAQFQPWYLALTLAIPPCAIADVLAGLEGFDKMLMDDATAADVPLVALEPWQTVIDVMTSGTADEQNAMLEMALMPADHQNAMFVAMLDSYFKGQIAEIWEVSRLSMRDIPNISEVDAAALFEQTEETLLNARNLAWIPKITEAAQNSTNIVVAAGAAHLPGDTGVLTLLANEGWTISPLSQ